ncbi:META domain-containing protein [Antiquaquibacter oligotrophicus]|uniref:META domain-containing protein n=1 Tax=Antiquaquibacter oligotrophicus TaxID=2880260 RepID=UPI002AC981FD|nr:hypothetical protein [Antiquaquibacter oligotrophicus]UDF12789.1 META domain-containing protein [Antiquaquibacter oligotrophicus]
MARGTWQTHEDGRVSISRRTAPIPAHCPGSVLVSWLDRTSLAGIEKGVVVLLDAEAEEVGRLSPVPESGVDWHSRDLVGAWTVTDPENIAGSTLEFAPRMYILTMPCGELMGDWGSLDGVFLAMVWGSGGCRLADDEIPWLVGAREADLDDGTLSLRDEDGSVLARLERDPDSASGGWPAFSAEEVAAELADPVALPASLSPGSIAGEWTSLTSERASSVHFDPDGTLRGTDDCNDQLGRWAPLQDGRVLVVVQSVMTLMYCGERPIEEWDWRVRLAGFDGETLVMLDNTGAELDRLVPVSNHSEN